MFATYRDRGSLSAVFHHCREKEAALPWWLRSRRCHRLKKQCFFQEKPKRKRTRVSKPTYVPNPPPHLLRATELKSTRSRVAQLEQKLDSLVTLFTSNQDTLQANPLNQVSNVLLPRSPMSLDNAPTSGPSNATPSSTDLDGDIDTVETGRCDIVSDKIRHGTTAENLSAEPDEQEAEIMLLEFKANMAEQFPFVVIQPYSTSQSLRLERPFLWKAIVVAALHGNSDRQMALGTGLMKELTTRLLFRAEKSIDLLQALLVFIAWYKSLFLGCLAALHMQ